VYAHTEEDDFDDVTQKPFSFLFFSCDQEEAATRSTQRGRRVALLLLSRSSMPSAFGNAALAAAKEKVFVPATIASDVELRRKVIAVFNKRRQDFPSDSAHNDYLEFVEDVCFKLIEGIDVAETEKIVAKEKRERAKEIKARRERNEEEDKVTCPEKFGFIFGGERGTADLSRKAEEDEDASQMMMDYQPESMKARSDDANVHVAYTEYDETTEEGKKVKKEASLRACGFDPLKTEYERSVFEAFQTIRV